MKNFPSYTLTGHLVKKAADDDMHWYNHLLTGATTLGTAIPWWRGKRHGGWKSLRMNRMLAPKWKDHKIKAPIASVLNYNPGSIAHRALLAGMHAAKATPHTVNKWSRILDKVRYGASELARFGMASIVGGATHGLQKYYNHDPEAPGLETCIKGGIAIGRGIGDFLDTPLGYATYAALLGRALPITGAATAGAHWLKNTSKLLANVTPTQASEYFKDTLAHALDFKDAVTPSVLQGLHEALPYIERANIQLARGNTDEYKKNMLHAGFLAAQGTMWNNIFHGNPLKGIGAVTGAITDLGKLALTAPDKK